MSTLRELVVNIDFEGIDVRRLLKIDSAVDEIEDSFRDMGGEINRVARRSEAMGQIADNALEEIQREAFLASLAVDNMGDQFGQAALKAGAFGLAATGAIAAVIAASAPILALGGALGASFLAAGVGAAAYGSVAVSALGQVFDAADEVAKLEEKIANAKTEQERILALKELAALYGDMSKEQRGALKDLREFQDFWGGFTKQFEAPVFKAFSNVLNGLEKTFTKLAPTISNVADVMVDLTDGFNKSLDTAGATKFFDWLETNAAESIRNWSETIGNFTAGLTSMLMAFDPITESVEQGFVGMSQRFREWAGNLENNQSFQNFIEYAKTNGPILMELFGNIVDLGKNIVTELAPIGSVILDGFRQLTGFVNDNWGPLRETVIGVGAAVGSFLVLMKGLQVIGAINTLFTAWRTGTVMQTLAMWGLNTALLANPLTWIVAGIAAVVGAGVLLYRNWDTVKEKAGQLWSWLKEKFSGIKDSILSSLEPVMEMIDRLTTGFGRVKDFISNFDASKYWGMFKNGVTKAFGGGVDGSHATGLENVPKNNYVANLHKGEAVLRTDQANALRGAGILGSKGNKPTVDIGGGGTTFAPSITVYANGGNADEVAQAVRREMERFWLQMSLKQA